MPRGGQRGIGETRKRQRQAEGEIKIKSENEVNTREDV